MCRKQEELRASEEAAAERGRVETAGGVTISGDGYSREEIEVRGGQGGEGREGGSEAGQERKGESGGEGRRGRGREGRKAGRR